MLYKTALEVHCSLYVHVIQRYITKDSKEHNILCITTTWLLSLETILFKTHFKQTFFNECRTLYCDVRDWQYKSSAEFKHSALVILL